MVSRDSKVDNFTNFFFFFFFLLIIMRSGLLTGIKWSVCMLKPHMNLCVSFSRTGAGLCIYHLFVWSNWNLLHISQWNTFSTHYYYCYYSFRIFHICVSWWTFTGVWVTACLLKSPGPFSVFWPFPIMYIVWMISIRLPISKSSSPFNNPLSTIPKARITIIKIITIMFHSFFNSLARSRYLSFFSHYFSFILKSTGTAKLTILQILFFWLLYGLVVWPS